MQYWNEMNTKYGFSDGESYPAGIEIFRDLYVKAVSRLAEHFGSDFRVVPYNRCGVHNYCLWFYVTKEWFESIYLPLQKSGQMWPSVGEREIRAAETSFANAADDAMQKAVDRAFELELDNYVEVEVKLADDFGEFLLNCGKETECKHFVPCHSPSA